MDWQPGDIAACYGTSPTCRLIRWATVAPSWQPRLILGPSHVALIVPHPDYGRLWIESTMLCPRPCLVRHVLTSGVQAHDPDERAHDYLAAGGRVEVWRLTPMAAFAADEASRAAEILLRHFVYRGVHYHTGGALLSATRAMKFTRLLPPPNLQAVFCSELIAALLMRLHRLSWTNPTRFNPASLLRRLAWSGVYRFHAEIRR